jgi:ABC-type antimicrobial peptide transport system permease subunit
VVIVNQAFVRQFFPNEDPIGKRFGTGSPEDSGAFQIVGVFADFKMTDPRGEVRPLFFRALAQQYNGFKGPADDAAEKASMFVRFIIVDFARPQSDVESLLRRTLAEIDASLTIDRFASYDVEVANNFNQDRLIARLSGLFGCLALILASVGLYGVMSYFVARRTTEIGVRMALGATRASVISLVLRGALGQVVVGLALGIPAALFVGRAVSSMLYDVSGTDPIAFAGSILLLAACATFASLLPARRAASIEPMSALRTE